MTKILVIEDTVALREEILQMLELMNFEGISAATGLAGIELAQQHLPDVILCAIMMSKMNGYDVLQTLRRNPETAQIPFIFLTAKAERTDFRRGMNLGADDYLTKPFTADELIEAISARLYKQATVTIPYVAEMKRAAEQIGQMAFRDALTGLPNRILFQQRLQEALAQAGREPSQSIAVFCLSVLGYRSVNIQFGSASGDALLKAIVPRLTDCISPQDTVARLSNDEFSLLIQLDDGQTAAQVAEKLLKALSVPYLIENQSIPVQVQMGATIYPADNSPAPKLLNHAILALNWVRKQSGSACQFYNAEIAYATASRAVIAGALEPALNRAELQIYYQPQVNLVTGRIIGAEALLRWQSADLGTISPATFVPVAEETGLILPIGAWMLRAACAQAKIWQSKHLLPIRISVNLSAYQFKQPGLIKTIAQALEETGLDANLLAIELTEATIMEDAETSLIRLQQVRELGVHISIDDFGTGYSSLSYLTRLPIDVLKIDQSFVCNIPADTHATTIASAITALAHSLDMRVVAEGVETKEQLSFLRRQGCNAIQGYLFSPAIPDGEFEQLLADDRRLVFN
ncbi:EAL domain-containing protein [Phormidium tenue FACHB-886]|nr:EAL domain-containing protein [Phormidium tenue FACHB-886]